MTHITGAELWKGVFGNDSPVSVEIGSGRGEYLLASARSQPNRNFYGIELSRRRVEKVEKQIISANLTNARVIAADATCLVPLLPDSCVDAYVIQFPDPWWKRRHHRRRLLTGPFVATLARTLVPGGTIDLVTDVADYFTMAQGLLDAQDNLEPVSASAVDEDLQTTFAKKARTRRTKLHSSVHRRVTHLVATDD